MHMPALGSAAAALAVSLIYFLWPPAPDTQMRTARASLQEEPTGASPDRISPPRGGPGTASDRSVQELDCPVLCEIPRGRATVHWTEYLEFSRVAGAGAQSGQRIGR